MSASANTPDRLAALDAELTRLVNERTSLLAAELVAADQQASARAAALQAARPADPALDAVFAALNALGIQRAQPQRVAYLGPEATFSHAAARQFFGAATPALPQDSIGDVFQAVQKGQAEYGVVPIENSTEGAVTYTLDAFVASRLRICGEMFTPIAHNLLAAGDRAQLRRIASHPQVLGQCRRWIEHHLPGLEQLPVSSTARAAQQAAGDPTCGALASALAAELYGLRTLADNIQDQSDNTTRFWVLATAETPPSGHDKTSLLFTVRHRVGALHDALATFKRHQVNLCKIESRPSRAQAWEYLFFVDVEGHAQDATLAAALAEMDGHCTLLRVLGSYPRARSH